ncbi:MAG: hypothetical protein LLG42_11605 [Chloroflexi bacterium]|nr:hypothetical protein [Chloroflexota bacterium]
MVESINALNPAQQAAFLCDRVMVGDAVMEVTGAYRINYGIMGNSEPILSPRATCPSRWNTARVYPGLIPTCMLAARYSIPSATHRLFLIYARAFSTA